MKKLLLLLFCLSITSMMMAGVTTFDFSTGYTNAQPVATVTKAPVTITFDKGTGSTVPAWYSTGSALRLYASGTVKFTATAAITNVAFTFTSASYNFTRSLTTTTTASVGTYSESGATGTWTGNATSVTITAAAGTGHARITKIVVTTSDAAVAVIDPVITPDGGQFVVSQTVSLSCKTDSAAIYYTTDNTVPTDTATLYTVPFDITKTTTVKAIAYKKTEHSNVVSSTFTAVRAVKNIAEFDSTAVDSVVGFSKPVLVLYQNGSNCYVKDSTGYMLIFGSLGQTYKNGDTIPAGFVGKRKLYNGYPEMVASTGFKAGLAGPVIEPEDIFTVDILGSKWGHYVKLPSSMVDTSKTAVIDNLGSIPYYNTFKIDVPTDSDYFYNVVAMVSAYSGKMQILPISCIVDSVTFDHLMSYGIEGKKYILKNDVKFLIQSKLSRTVADGSKEYVIFVVDDQLHFIRLNVDSTFYFNTSFFPLFASSINGRFSGKFINPTFTISGVMPVENTAFGVTFEYVPRSYDLVERFSAEANEPHYLTGYYSNGKLCTYSPNSSEQGQSIDLDFSYLPSVKDSLVEGNKYMIYCVAQLKDAWSGLVNSPKKAVPYNDPDAYKNYTDIVAGESELISGVDDVVATGVKVVATKGEITVTGAKNVRIYTMAGALVSTADKAEVAAGAYVVVADGKTVKVLVK
jgi:hypothetical protein